MLTSWRLKQLQTAYWLQYFSFHAIPFHSIPFCINSFPLVLLLLLLNGFTKNVGLLAVLSVMKKLLITIAHRGKRRERESGRENEQMKTRNERNNIKSKRFIANMVPSIVNVCVSVCALRRELHTELLLDKNMDILWAKCTENGWHEAPFLCRYIVLRYVNV